MLLIEDLGKIKTPFKDGVITIGNFDGVHIGHQALFHEVIERADAVGGVSMAMTFEPHPLRLFKKDNPPPLITLNEQKVELIEKSGLDTLICVPFTEDFARLEAETFVSEILLDLLGVKTLVVGPDYSFGRARQGNVDFLKRLAGQLDFQLVVAPWIESVGPGSERISSTKIRQLVQDGLMEEAARLLGRDYQVRGEVVRGRDRGGKVLGFPTANIHLHDELCPKTGVYVVTVEWNGDRYLGVANLGYSPTFEDHQFTVEVHILDFSGDLYEKKIKVNFITRLRGEIKFPGIEALSEQIKKDIDNARRMSPL